MAFTNKDVLIVLGCTNDDSGVLSSLAKERADKAIEVLSKHQIRCVLTGGFGPHFNATTTPHYEYMRHYIEGQLTQPMHFIQGISSANTFEDAQKTSELLNDLDYNNAYVITSDFHAARVGMLFELFCKKRVRLITSITKKNARELIELMQHEIKAISYAAKLNNL
ncbi:YdcF family protein [Pseudoalteromonas rubra]|uniref:YdcF family protein n=1 Tax=Pseudoalteromonas rubra TaxID=43658 RepID=UPI002DB983D6|nr:YdcF family protein [Pseudoalteromonas rubra]MEC4090733.1 YdcF family protein [Pseudoalteromonas rubra]